MAKLELTKLGMNRAPLLAGAGCGVAFVSGFAFEMISGNLGTALVLGISGAAALELGVAVSTVNGRMRLLLPLRRRSKTQISTESGEVDTQTEANTPSEMEPEDSLSVVAHPALGQVEMSAASVPLRDTIGGIYIDSMDVLREGIQQLNEKESIKQVSEPAAEPISEPIIAPVSEPVENAKVEANTVAVGEPLVNAPVEASKTVAVNPAADEKRDVSEKREKAPAAAPVQKAKSNSKEKVKETVQVQTQAQKKPVKKGKPEKKKPAKAPKKQEAEKDVKTEKASIFRVKSKPKPKH